MFDVSAYYKAAQSGDPVDAHDLITYIRGFQRVVLWGASYLGQAVSRHLAERGVQTSQFWDLRAKDLKTVNDVAVLEPFTGDFDPETTLVILCIGNTIIQPSLSLLLARAKFHYILGDHVFMGIGCTATKEHGVDPEACMRAMTCRAMYCDRLSNIVNHRSLQARPAPLEDAPIFMKSLTVVVNQVCSLKCKFCTSYMNAYDQAERVNFPIERIVEDIDRFFQAVDSVGTVTVMGGEPFLHPDLGEVVQALLRHKNCGLISISTSGTCQFRKRQLDLLKDPQVNVSFSNYLTSLGDRQGDLFWRNVEMVRAEGVPHTVGVTMPEWIIPSTMSNKHYSVDEMTYKKQNCWPRTDQLKNGKLHPCDFSNTVYNVHVADYASDYVDVAHIESMPELRKRIREYRNAPYYQTCGHCNACGDLTSNAGEQGFHEFKPVQVP